MSTQMIVRIDEELKKRANRLARQEGKNLSELVRDLLLNYTKERDMALYIDDLWATMSAHLKRKGVTEKDIKTAIRKVRSNQ